MKKKLAYLGSLAVVIGIVTFSLFNLQTQGKGEEDVVKADTTKPMTDENTSVWEVDIGKIANGAKQELERIQENAAGNHVIIDGKKHNVTNAKLEKWIIRNYIDSAMVTGEPVTGEQLVRDAVESNNKRNDLFKYARKEYGVKVQPSDVKKYIGDEMTAIEENEQASQFFEELSSALGITKKEFYYDWEYDNYAMQYVSQKVYPILEENNPTKEGETSKEHNDRIFRIFNDGLNDFRNK